MRKLVLLLGLTLLVPLAWMLLGDPDSNPPAQEQPTVSEAVRGVPIQGELPGERVPEVEPPPFPEDPSDQRQPVPASATAGSGPTVIRGRVVDFQILPLEGVDVRLRGFERFTLEQRRLEREPREAFEAPEGVITESDGEFEFVFYAPERMTLRLNLIKSGHATLTGTWESIQPGEVVDLGDLVLNPAVSVTVRVVDSDGEPRPGVSVTLARERGLLDEVEGQFRQRNSFARSTTAEGSMTFREGVPAGPWMVSATPGTLLRPKTVDILPYQEQQLIELVMESESSLPTLRGVVTDTDGAPVARAYVMPADRSFGSPARTGPEGEFTLRGPPDLEGGEIVLQVGHPQFESSGELGPFHWGQSDLKITLHPGADLEIGVRNGDDVVTEYSWYLLPTPDPNGAPLMFGGPRNGVASSLTEEGTVRIPRLPRGPYLLHVRVPEDVLAMKQFQTVLVGDGRNQVWVELFPTSSRPLHVVSGDEPVEGVRVQVLQPLNGTILSEDTTILDLEGFFGPLQNAALVVQSGTTDSQGAFTMRAASAQTGLRLSASGFEPTVVSRVDLAIPEPLVVNLFEGGRIRGVIRPLDLLRDLRLFSPPTVRARGSGLELQVDRLDATGPRRRLSQGGTAAIAADGSFTSEALETGDYRLSIRWLRPYGTGGGAVSIELIQIAEIIGLRRGEQRDLGTLHLEHLRRGELRGRVLLNGESADGQLVFSPQDGGLRETAHLGTDGDYRIALIAGYYWASLLPTRDDRTVFGHRLVQVTPGTSQQLDLPLELRSLTLDVRDEQNNPVPSASLNIMNPESGQVRPLPPTSQLGTLQLWLLPGAYRFLRGQEPLADVVIGSSNPEPLSIRWPRR